MIFEKIKLKKKKKILKRALSEMGTYSEGHAKGGMVEGAEKALFCSDKAILFFLSFSFGPRKSCPGI